MRKNRKRINWGFLGFVFTLAFLEALSEITKEKEETNLGRIKQGLSEAEENLQELNKSLVKAQLFNESIQKAMESAPTLGETSPYMASLENMEEESELLIKNLEVTIEGAKTTVKSWESLLAKHQGDE